MAGIPAESPLVLRGISGFLPQPPYFSGGLRRGFTFGLSARRSFGREVCIPCRTERHRLPRPERRGLRSPWGQACSSANRSTDPHYWRAGPLAQSENLRSVLVIAWFVLRKTWRYYRAIRYAFETASAILFSLARTFGARPHSCGSPVTKQFRLRASSGLRAS